MKKLLYLFIGLFAFVVIARIPFDWYAKIDEAGQFGDAFGFANALLNGLALLAIIYSIYLQRQEINENKKQLDKSIAAQEEQALLQYVPLKYEVINRILPKVENELTNLKNKYGLTIKDKITKENNTDLYEIDIMGNTKLNNMLDNELSRIPEIKLKSEELKNLKQQLKELDQYMMLDNPASLKNKISTQSSQG